MPEPKPEYQPGDRVKFQVTWWWPGDETPTWEGTVIDSVWDDEHGCYYYHLRDITGPKEKVGDGGIILEHEIVGSKAMQAMKNG